MIEAVDFVSLATFEALKPTERMVALSIGDPAQMPPANLVQFAAWRRDEFLDCEPEDLEQWGIPEEALCSLEAVTQMRDYIALLHGGSVRYRLVVHCRMGSSRSAAVALMAHAMTGCDFPRHADAHFANKHVVALARLALGTDIVIPEKLQGDEPHPYLPLSLQI